MRLKNGNLFLYKKTKNAYSIENKTKGWCVMTQITEMQKEQYNKYVEQVTPKHNVWTNMLKAFVVGGLICFLGQVIFNYCKIMFHFCRKNKESVKIKLKSSCYFFLMN